MEQEEVDWDRLDKQKFVLMGLGLFSGVTTCLYPLTVIKTRQMANAGVSSGLSGTVVTTRAIWAGEGVRGFYRGFGTVIVGTIPVRILYMNALEATKAGVTRLGKHMDLSATATATLANSAGGAAASLSAQVATVPVDVITQRLMVQGAAASTAVAGASPAAAAASASGQSAAAAAAMAASSSSSSSGGASAEAAGSSVRTPGAQGAAPLGSSAAEQRRGMATLVSSSGRVAGAPSAVRVGAGGTRHWSPHAVAGIRGLSTAGEPTRSGLAMARLIIAQEGVAGLYRGFFASLSVYVPKSAAWWGAYGFWQKLIWAQRAGGGAAGIGSGQAAAAVDGRVASGWEVAGVQAGSAVLAGVTSALLTNPLDVLKTRLQVAEVRPGEAPPTWGATLRQLLQQDGPGGLLRGVAPRMASSAVWGTAMVSVYEFLKKNSVATP